MKLSELLSVPLLEEMIHDGYIVRRWHRDWDLAILNYTDKAQFENEWNPVTRQCRGLIVRYDDDFQDAEVIARPFPKFFNYGQPGADEIGLDEPAYVTDKMDGSLGIAYLTPDGKPAIATRGSFHSEQAEWATKWLRESGVYDKSAYSLSTLGKWTDLFEIIYPENRIVVDYGDRAELVYLGTVEIEGAEFMRFSGLECEAAARRGETLRDALEIEPRENAEGVVVMTDDGRAVKLKQEDYLLKHRARFSLTPMRIWEAISSDMEISDFLDGMPDEFHEAIANTWGKIEATARVYLMVAEGVARSARGIDTRKKQAAYIKAVTPNHAAAAFALLDGNREKAIAASRKAAKPTGPAATTLIG